MPLLGALQLQRLVEIRERVSRPGSDRSYSRLHGNTRLTAADLPQPRNMRLVRRILAVWRFVVWFYRHAMQQEPFPTCATSP